MGGYRDLEGWRKAMLLATDIHALARKMPKSEGMLNRLHARLLDPAPNPKSPIPNPGGLP
ncbi:MAG: four helix bundle protein [Hydrogenophilaceae bacterium]|jgi:hypothetical protein|nr:four helix bundle protein [Hydrogenophilaceae bacterium]